MWSLILYFLFGIGQAANAQTPTVQVAVSSEADQPGDNGGETSTPIPPRPPKR